ncbi:MAG TPA: SGNH/GDSL hydrolase family protein [Acidobacteriaceae bacterium]|nr:SGNH/GDSL hydrolase family protein [Acidobacteriaceae bacterium]
MRTAFLFTFCLIALIGSAYGAETPGPKTISVSDPLILSSVLDETWDISHAATEGYIDCMMSLSDVDLTVLMTKAGSVTLNFDPRVYAPSQPATAGPIWKVQVDGDNPSDRVILGPTVSKISTAILPPGSHRIRFTQSANTSSPRWFAHDPQLSRLTGVTLPQGAQLEKSKRPAVWFLPITDSIGEGAVDMNTTTATWRNPGSAYTDSTQAWLSHLAQLLDKSVAGYIISGIGIVRGGAGAPYGALNPQDPTGANDPWDHIFADVPRPFTTAPDFILLCIGTNEWATDPHTKGHGEPADPTSSDAAFQANVETFFSRVRAHSQLAATPIYVSVPFGGYKRTALQKAVASYRAAHPDETHIELFDVAFASPALTTTAGIDETTLFGGLTKNRPDDKDTTPSPQSSDRTHPYAIATPAIGSVNAHQQIAQVIAPRLAAMLKGGRGPESGELNIGKLQMHIREHAVQLICPTVKGGSAPYLYQFQKSLDNGLTWISVGQPIGSMQATVQPIEMTDPGPARGTLYRANVTDSAEPEASAHTPPVDPFHKL